VLSVNVARASRRAASTVVSMATSLSLKKCLDGIPRTKRRHCTPGGVRHKHSTGIMCDLGRTHTSGCLRENVTTLWRTHSCVPCRDSSRHPHLTSAGIDKSVDAARMGECATNRMLTIFLRQPTSLDQMIGSEATNSLGFNPLRPVGNGNAAAASITTLLRPSFSRQFSKTPC
jgi:hypothetical protein